MIKMKKILKEDPDDLYTDNAYVFGYYKNILYIALGETHHELCRQQIPDFKYTTTNARNFLKIPGRFSKSNKEIAFWVDPTKAQLKKLIQDVYNKVKIKIDNTWTIHKDSYNKIIYVPLDEYLGEKKISSRIDIPHLQSPAIKDKRDVDGFGSDKYSKLVHPAYNSIAQMNYYNKNRYFNEMKLISILKKLNVKQILEKINTDFKIGYHVAPVSARNSIKKNGLNSDLSHYARSIDDKEIYFFLKYNEALWYKNELTRYNHDEGENEEFEIWKINLKGLKIEKDFGLNSSGDGNDSAYYIKNTNISKNKLTLMR